MWTTEQWHSYDRVPWGHVMPWPNFQVARYRNRPVFAWAGPHAYNQASLKLRDVCCPCSFVGNGEGEHVWTFLSVSAGRNKPNPLLGSAQTSSLSLYINIYIYIRTYSFLEVYIYPKHWEISPHQVLALSVDECVRACVRASACNFLPPWYWYWYWYWQRKYT